MNRFIFVFIHFFISNVYAVPLSDMSDEDLKTALTITNQIEKDRMFAQNLSNNINQIKKTEENQHSTDNVKKGFSDSLMETVNTADFTKDLLSSLKKNVTPDMLIDAAKKIHKDLLEIYKAREEERKTKQSFWDKTVSYAKQVVESWWVVEKTMIILSWTVGFHLAIDVLPKIIMPMIIAML